MRSGPSRPAVILIGAGVLLFGVAGDSKAQLKGHYIPGFTGLQSGSQPPPSVALLMPVYWYGTDDIRNDAGQSLGIQPRVNVLFVGAGVAWVTNVKFLGANLGGSVVPVAFLKSRIEGASLDVEGDMAFTDITLQPVIPTASGSSGARRKGGPMTGRGQRDRQGHAATVGPKAIRRSAGHRLRPHAKTEAAVSPAPRTREDRGPALRRDGGCAAVGTDGVRETSRRNGFV